MTFTERNIRLQYLFAYVHALDDIFDPVFLTNDDTIECQVEIDLIFYYVIIFFFFFVKTLV